MPMAVLSRLLPPGATPAQKRRAEIRRKRVLALVLELVAFSKPTSRSKREPRMRMDWQARRDGLSNREFLKRYKVSKSKFAQLCEDVRPSLEPPQGTRNPISTEIALSMTLRFLAGAHVYDIVDLHGVAEPTFFNKLHQVSCGGEGGNACYMLICSLIYYNVQPLSAADAAGFGQHSGVATS